MFRKNKKSKKTPTALKRDAKTKAGLRQGRITPDNKKALQSGGEQVPKAEARNMLSFRRKMLDSVPRTKIKVIGIGGGGGSIVSEIAKNKSFKEIDFIAVNTDLQALTKAAKECKVLKLGQTLTQGLGCGMNSELGEKAARKDQEKIKNILEKADFCILVACLGGGMGSGAAPVFAEISKALKKNSLGIFTLPFKFEGEKKRSQAFNSLRKMKLDLNAINIIPNEKIFQTIDKTTSLKTALSVINQKLAFDLEGLIEMIYKPGLINIDWADFKTILEGRGKICYLNRAEAQGEDRAAAVAKTVVQSPLNEYGLGKADRILFNIRGNKDLKMQEVDQISKFLFNFNKKAKIIFGISLLPYQKFGSRGLPQSETNKIGITLLATRTEKASAKIRSRIREASIFKEKKKLKTKKQKFSISQTVIPPTSKNETKASKKKFPPAKIKKLFRRKETSAQGSEQKLKALKENKSLGRKAGSSGKIRSKRKSSLLPDKSREITRSAKELRPKKIVESPPQLSPQKEKVKEEKSEESLSQPERENSLRSTKTIRKNALALRREVEKAEKEILAAEKKWDFPAFLRRKTI